MSGITQADMLRLAEPTPADRIKQRQGPGGRDRDRKRAYDREYTRRWRAANRARYAAVQRAWAAANPEKYRDINQRSRARHRLRRSAERYGLTVDQLTALIEAQGSVCAICRRPEQKVGRGSTPQLLSVDHDHITGRVRGLLCDGCNVGLGRFAHDPAWLRSAAEYLEAAA